MDLAREIRIYGIAVGLFAVLHFSLTAASTGRLGAEGFETLRPWINAIAYLLYVLTGFVSGFVAERRQVLHGVVAGALAAATAILIFRVAVYDGFGMLALLATGTILGGLGGLSSLLVCRGRARGS